MGSRGGGRPPRQPTTCIILKSATFISTATGSTHITPVGTHILLYRAEPGSDSARALEELRSLAGTRSAPAIWLTRQGDSDDRRAERGTRCAWRPRQVAAVHQVEATVITGGGLWAIKGQPQDPRPRRMTVALDHEWASVRPFGADDQKQPSLQSASPSKSRGREVSERLNPRESFGA